VVDTCKLIATNDTFDRQGLLAIKKLYMEPNPGLKVKESLHEVSF